ncbi:hypothetical protein SNOG_11717 [Parastagonospora nodorum SN15]|uniref:Uncharacterized protein n=1 Tax=Phaeosphaeria nodorum (strain SN15 / ATCC MYA-4574 / FGSC 10173) TaxID=321614 RepID=Q0U947_PHANO|nr:hypothetical protein SNOG_11717 [Parastagonospora nodorum SN15]EAT80761.1 hypothetical protein SNOG_11717 [Parastagonospora nodorum SN15]
MQYQDHNSAGGIDQQGTPANFGWDCCIYGDQYACMKIHGPEQAILEGEEAVWEVEQVEQEDTSDDDEDDSSDEDDTSDEDDASDEVEETEDGFEGYEQTAVHATSSRSFFQFHNTAKTSSRFRTLTGKAKEHLRDENNRKKAVETFQNGMREVTAFVTEIQAKQGAAGSKRAGPKGDGKELAMICGKVAMKRFKK